MKNAAKIAERITSTVQEQSQHKLVENPEIVNIDDLIDMIDPDFLNDAVGAVSQDGFSNSLDARKREERTRQQRHHLAVKVCFVIYSTRQRRRQKRRRMRTQRRRWMRSKSERGGKSTTTTTTTKSKDKTKKKKKKEQQENLLKQMDINEFVAWAHKSKS